MSIALDRTISAHPLFLARRKSMITFLKWATKDNPIPYNPTPLIHFEQEIINNLIDQGLVTLLSQQNAKGKMIYHLSYNKEAILRQTHAALDKVMQMTETLREIYDKPCPGETECLADKC